MVMIGQQLKEIREAKDLSQSEVANQLHISRQTISKWELNKSLPDLQSLQQLAVLFSLSLDELLNVAEERKKMLHRILPAELVSQLIKEILPKKELTADEHMAREDFILREVVQPLSEKLGEETKIYWLGIEKKTSVPPNISVPPISDVSQTYLKLFEQDCSSFYLLTNTGIVYIDSIRFFEEDDIIFYSFVEMAYLCLGRYYDVMSSSQENPNAIGIFMQDMSYNLITITKKAGREFALVMKQLDFSGEIYRELTTVNLIDFQKKWRHRKQLPN